MVYYWQLHFSGPYRHQNWTYPDSLIYYAAKNPLTARLYQKLIKTCKYFFTKNRDVATIKWLYPRFLIGRGISNAPPKDHWCNNWNNNSIASTILRELSYKPLFFSISPKFYQCGTKEVYLMEQIISLNDLLFIGSKIKNITFNEITVTNQDYTFTTLEKLFEVLPKVTRFILKSVTSPSNINSNTVKELLKLPHLNKIEYFQLNEIPEAFDLNTFYIQMKKNKLTRFILKFVDSISKGYKMKLESIIDEILKTELPDFKHPYIHFHGLDFSKTLQLKRICFGNY